MTNEELIEVLRGMGSYGYAYCNEAADAIEELMALLKECADDLEDELGYRYGNVHPVLQDRYDRDMEPVRQARKLVGEKE